MLYIQISNVHMRIVTGPPLRRMQLSNAYTLRWDCSVGTDKLYVYLFSILCAHHSHNDNSKIDATLSSTQLYQKTRFQRPRKYIFFVLLIRDLINEKPAGRKSHEAICANSSCLLSQQEELTTI
jgi:hypothetical protein